MRRYHHRTWFLREKTSEIIYPQPWNTVQPLQCQQIPSRLEPDWNIQQVHENATTQIASLPQKCGRQLFQPEKEESTAQRQKEQKINLTQIETKSSLECIQNSRRRQQNRSRMHLLQKCRWWRTIPPRPFQVQQLLLQKDTANGYTLHGIYNLWSLSPWKMSQINA